jgi:1,4-alpha-glucan branching enzyme
MKVEEIAQPNQKVAKPIREKATNHTRGKRRILFEVTAEPGAKVFVAGNFNRWEAAKHRLTDKGHPGHFRRYVYVEPGQVEYKFLIDGKWQIDCNCPHWKPNNFGTLNSVTDAP